MSASVLVVTSQPLARGTSLPVVGKLGVSSPSQPATSMNIPVGGGTARHAQTPTRESQVLPHMITSQGNPRLKSLSVSCGPAIAFLHLFV